MCHGSGGLTSQWSSPPLPAATGWQGPDPRFLQAAAGEPRTQGPSSCAAPSPTAAQPWNGWCGTRRVCPVPLLEVEVALGVAQLRDPLLHHHHHHWMSRRRRHHHHHHWPWCQELRCPQRRARPAAMSTRCVGSGQLTHAAHTQVRNHILVTKIANMRGMLSCLPVRCNLNTWLRIESTAQALTQT